jgi:hypothetical protein
MYFFPKKFDLSSKGADNLRITFLSVISVGEQRNHGLKYESDCVSIGIGMKI